MKPGTLLRVGIVYHALLAVTLLLLAGDLFAAMHMDPPRCPGLVRSLGVGPAVAAITLELARRRPGERSGLLLAVQVGELAAMVAILVAVVWAELPSLLLGPGFAAGLWAWLLWNISPLGQEERS